MALKAVAATASGGGSGTVTSVAIAAPAIFTVSGSPIIAAGTLTLTATGTSGGVPYFNAANTLASSVALTASALVMGGGAGAAPATPLALGTTTQVLHGNAAGAPTWGAVSLTADVSGVLPAANGGTGSALPYFLAGTILPGAKPVSGQNTNLSVGDNVLYTVPAGKRAFFLGQQTYVNDTGGACTIFWGVGISGTTYRMESATSRAAGAAYFSNNISGVIFPAGTTFLVNDTVGGGSAFGSFLEFNDTARVNSAIITAVAASNDLYTCPASTTARILTATSLDPSHANPASGFRINQSGGAITAQVYFVPSGGSAGADNRLNATAGVSLANNATTTFNVPNALNAGDKIVVDLSGTGTTQLIALPYIEFPT